MNNQRPYRAIPVGGKELVYGYFLYRKGGIDNNSDLIDPAHLIYDGRKSIEVIPSTIGQSTGLKDKNGVDLDWWEGDLFKFLTGMVAELVFKKGSYVFVDIKTRNEYNACECIMWREIPVRIGNIHQEANNESV